MGKYRKRLDYKLSDGRQITIVIPLFNKQQYIARAVRSVLSQTVKNYEVIIVDDGSTDASAMIVSNIHDPSIRLLRQNNQGASAARNAGIKEARSALIAFLDADDEWAPDHLETLLSLSRRFPSAGAYATAYSHVFREKHACLANFAAIPFAPWEDYIPDYFKSAVYGDPPVCSSSVAVPKKVFEVIGMFKNGEVMGEDLDMWARIAIEYKIAFSWKGMVYYREDSDGRISENKAIEKALPFVDSFEILPEEYETSPYLDLYVSEMKINHICSLIFLGKRREALRFIKKLDVKKTRKTSMLKVLIYLVMPLGLIEKIRQLRLKMRC